VVPIISNRARLIVASTKSHAAANSTTNTPAVVTCRSTGIRCMRTGDDTSSAAKPSTIPAATLSCRCLLTVSGTQPTIDRLTPMTLKNTCAEVAAPLRAAERPARIRSRRTPTPRSVTSMPETMRVPLNRPPERSWKVPRRLKCRRHHSGSVVVRIDANTPVLSTTITAIARCTLVIRDSVRPESSARGEATTNGRETGRTALIRVDSTHDG
jgi:hypothetical protein